MSWDTELLPVPAMPYIADYYNDCENALVALLEADGYTSTTTGDGGIQTIAARPFSMGDVETLFAELTADDVPAIYVHAEGKGEDEAATAEEWAMPINCLVAVVQASTSLTTLDNNTKRRLGEVERVLRQLAGGAGTAAFWNDTEVTVGPSIIMIGTEPDVAYRGVGWLQVTVRKRVLNRLEAL